MVLRSFFMYRRLVFIFLSVLLLVEKMLLPCIAISDLLYSLGVKLGHLTGTNLESECTQQLPND